MAEKIVIGLDAMGGDFAPAEPVLGGYMAAKENPEIELVLIGREEEIKEHLPSELPNLRIHHASQVISMEDPPALSIRRKKDSSISVGADLLKKGEISAFVSAGNTGAVVSAATLKVRLLPGIERPGLAVVFPTMKGTPVVIIDVGANIDTKPTHLLQYGLMATVYCRLMWEGVENPRVGILNIGEEESKGTSTYKEAASLLKGSGLNFVGNVEGKDIFKGLADIVVMDGFVGNVVLKVSEGAADAVITMLKREIYEASWWTKLGAMLFLLPAYKRLKKKIDYSEYGGALLLGINGVCIICHGRSNARAIRNAIMVAVKEIKRKVNEKILEELKSLNPTKEE